MVAGVIAMRILIVEPFLRLFMRTAHILSSMQSPTYAAEAHVSGPSIFLSANELRISYLSWWVSVS